MLIAAFIVAFGIFGLVSIMVMVDHMDKAAAKITAFTSSSLLFFWMFYTFITALEK